MMARPSVAQRLVLLALEAGGHIERASGEDAVLVAIDGTRKMLHSVYWRMWNVGWLWEAAEGVWRITASGEQALREVR